MSSHISHPHCSCCYHAGLFMHFHNPQCLGYGIFLCVWDYSADSWLTLNGLYSPFLCQVSGPQWVRKCAMFVRTMSLADMTGKCLSAAKRTSRTGWDQLWLHLYSYELSERSSKLIKHCIKMIQMHLANCRVWTHPHNCACRFRIIGSHSLIIVNFYRHLLNYPDYSNWGRVCLHKVISIIHTDPCPYKGFRTTSPI